MLPAKSGAGEQEGSDQCQQKPNSEDALCDQGEQEGRQKGCGAHAGSQIGGQVHDA